MAEALKTLISPAAVEVIAASLPVDRRTFVAACLEDFDTLELMDRGRRIAAVMRDHLDPDPAVAVDHVAASIGPDLGLGYLAHSFFIGTYGLPVFAPSMAAQHRLTQAFTAEFSIRGFIAEYPQTMDVLRTWTRDPSEHVRRLVSEGTRPRLPWAARLPAFQEDPYPVIDLLERLKDDPSAYVQRSVGNNLNDISKDHPDVAMDVAATWAPSRPRLVRRGLRTLVKAGDLRALEILGYGPTSVTVHADLPARLQMGQKLRLVLDLSGHDQVLVDVRIHSPRPGGRTSTKVYRGGEVAVDGTAQIRKTISFAPMTTRTHHAGIHRVEALVNGAVQPLGEFLLTG